MEEDQCSSNRNSTKESAQLVKTLLERRPTVKEQVDESPYCKTVNWVASKDFTVDVGLEQIEEYIQTWEMQPCWRHSLIFLFSTEEEEHTFYHFRARCSTTSWRRPIQGTASVYFVAVVSKVDPETLPVEVHFLVESNRLVHTPGRTRFREKWLADVLESKTSLQKEVAL